MGYGVISYDGYRVHLEDYGAIYTPAGMNLPERLDLFVFRHDKFDGTLFAGFRSFRADLFCKKC